MRERFARIPRRTWLLAAALLVALVAAWPLASGGGLLNTRGGGDSPFLLQRLQQLVAALEDGHFPVRWMADANYGYGYPFFNYYAPLSIYVAALFRLTGFSYVHSVQLAQVAGFLVAAWAAFRLGERWFADEWAALLGSAAYTLAPFHLVNVYVRGDSLAEFWAMALYPLVLLAADKVTAPAEGGRGAVLLLALAYGALVLSHNISALLFSPFLLLYLLLRVGRQRETWWPLAGAALGAVVLGLGLAAWFWVPALAEKALVQTGPITEGYFHYSAHFWGRELVQGSWRFDYEVAGRRAFRMGLVQALLVGGGMLALLWHWRREQTTRKRPTLFILLAVGIATLMITPLSRPLWEVVPLLPFTQFPWRFLSVQALAGAMATAALTLVVGRRRRGALSLALVALLLGAALGGLSTEHMALSDEDVSPARLAAYEWFTGNIGSTVSAEYLPQTVVPRPYTSPWLEGGERNRTQVLAGEATTAVQARAATAQRWAVAAGAGGAQVVFPTVYWPGWTAAIDGEPAAVAAAAGSGLMTVKVPAGEHTVSLVLQRTPIRLLAEALSLLALALVGLLALRGWRRSGSRLGNTVVVGVALLGLLLIRLWPAPPLSEDGLNWDFAQMGYLHHTPEGVAFSNGARLLRYEYSQESAVAGDEVRLTLYWEGTAPEATLALATPAVHRYPGVPLLPTVAEEGGPGASRFVFTVPAEAPAGLYVPQLTVAGGEPLLASGERRGDLFLRPLRIEAGKRETGKAATLQVEAGTVTVVGEPPGVGTGSGPVGCGEAQAGRLLVPLRWYTPRALSENYVASLRLLDSAGRMLAQCDVQPGYGFQPSSGWPAGEWVNDRLGLPLPAVVPEETPYALVVRLYPVGGESVLTRRLGELAWEGEQLAFTPNRPVFTVPEGIRPVAARFDEVATLRGYELAQVDQRAELTLYWEALAARAADYVRFVHLIDPASGQIVERADGSSVQRDGIPRQESYPTSQWMAGEIVRDPLWLSLEGVPPGTYRLAVGFYPAADPGARLAVVGDEGAADGLFILPAVVAVDG